MTDCPYCGTTLGRHENVFVHIYSHWPCRGKHYEAQLVAHRSTAAQALGVAEPQSYPISIVPYCLPEFVPVTDEQRSRMAGFLNELVTESEPDEEEQSDAIATVEEADSPEVTAQLGLICAVCQGYCCIHGGVHNAFITRKTLSRFATQQNILSLDEVVPIYLDYLPAEHRDNACLYQTAQGCNLPRDLRADICNQYECSGLRAARERLPTANSRCAVIVRHDNVIQKSAFINGTSIQHYNPQANDTDA